jgi:EPS-associated MarR family transcriptional regulator
MLSDESQYKLMRLLEANPEASQREIADALGISLGKANYCLRALIDKGFVKLRSFQQSRHKLRYAYILTPHGIKEKARVTKRFLAFKLAQYEQLEREIEEMRRDVDRGA